MATEIEKLLFRNRGAHAVVEMTLALKRLVLTVAPLSDLSQRTTVEFADCRLTSLDVLDDNLVELNLPWDIIGFDSDELGEARWSFCLHCSAIEHSFEAGWPRMISA